MAEIAERCRAFDEDLSALVDGELGATRRAELEAHLATCPGCSTRLAALRAVDAALAGLPSPAVAPDLQARLARRIADERSARVRARAPSPRGRRALRYLALPAAAAAALALYLALRAPSPPGAPVERVPIAQAPPSPVEPRPEPIAKAEPARPAAERAPAAEPAPAARVAERTPPPSAEPELESLGAEDLAVVLDLDTMEDLPVIANLEVLERLLDDGAG